MFASKNTSNFDDESRIEKHKLQVDGNTPYLLVTTTSIYAQSLGFFDLKKKIRKKELIAKVVTYMPVVFDYKQQDLKGEFHLSIMQWALNSDKINITKLEATADLADSFEQSLVINRLVKELYGYAAYGSFCQGSNTMFGDFEDYKQSDATKNGVSFVIPKRVTNLAKIILDYSMVSAIDHTNYYNKLEPLVIMTSEKYYLNESKQESNEIF